MKMDVSALFIPVVSLLAIFLPLYSFGSNYEEFIRQGVECYRASDYQGALKYFRQANESDQKNPQPYSLSGSVLIRMALLQKEIGNQAQADSLLMQAANQTEFALHFDQDYGMALYNKGLILLELRQPKTAERYFRQAILIDSTDVNAYLHLGRALYQQPLGDSLAVREALGVWQQALNVCQNCPQVVEIHIERGRAYYMLGDIDNAFDEFKKATALDSTDVNALYGLGQVLESKAALSSAAATFRKAVKYDSLQGRLYDIIGNIAHVQGDLMGAVRAWRKVAMSVKAKPSEGARALVKAVIDLNKLEQIMSDNCDYYFQAAVCLENSHREIHSEAMLLFPTRGALDFAIAEYMTGNNKVRQLFTGWESKTRYAFYMPDSIGEKLRFLQKKVKSDPQSPEQLYSLAIYQHIIAVIAREEIEKTSRAAAELYPAIEVPALQKPDPLSRPKVVYIRSHNSPRSYPYFYIKNRLSLE